MATAGSVLIAMKLLAELPHSHALLVRSAQLCQLERMASDDEVASSSLAAGTLSRLNARFELGYNWSGRPTISEGRTRDRQLAEDGSRLAGVGEDRDDEPQGGG